MPYRKYCASAPVVVNVSTLTPSRHGSGIRQGQHHRPSLSASIGLPPQARVASPVKVRRGKRQLPQEPAEPAEELAPAHVAKKARMDNLAVAGAASADSDADAAEAAAASGLAAPQGAGARTKLTARRFGAGLASRAAAGTAKGNQAQRAGGTGKGGKNDKIGEADKRAWR
jgi:hypothetical protein